MLSYAQDHTRYFVKQSELAAIEHQLQQLVATGLLISEDFLLAADMPVPDPERRQSQVAIVTKDRPDLVRRCLSTLLSGAQEDASIANVRVYDDSGDLRTRDVVNQIRTTLTGVQLEYIGIAERHDWSRRLARASSIPEDVVDFAMFGLPRCGPTYGANRNSVLLTNAGVLLTCVDDDLSFPAYASPGYRDRLRIVSTHDPLEIWPSLSRTRALDTVRCHPSELIPNQMRLLGRRFAECITEFEGAVDIDQLQTAFVRHLVSGDGRVALTMAGVVGDAGTFESDWLFEPRNCSVCAGMDNHGRSALHGRGNGLG